MKNSQNKEKTKQDIRDKYTQKKASWDATQFQKKQTFLENAYDTLNHRALKLAAFIGLAFLLRFSACTDEEGARKALDNYGKNEFGAPARYKPIKIGGFGYDAWDHIQVPGMYSTRFTAIDTYFKDTVNGVVTKKYFSDEAVIRIDRTVAP